MSYSILSILSYWSIKGDTLGIAGELSGRPCLAVHFGVFLGAHSSDMGAGLAGLAGVAGFASWLGWLGSAGQTSRIVYRIP